LAPLTQPYPQCPTPRRTFFRLAPPRAAPPPAGRTCLSPHEQALREAPPGHACGTRGARRTAPYAGLCSRTGLLLLRAGSPPFQGSLLCFSHLSVVQYPASGRPLSPLRLQRNTLRSGQALFSGPAPPSRTCPLNFPPPAPQCFWLFALQSPSRLDSPLRQAHSFDPGAFAPVPEMITNTPRAAVAATTSSPFCARAPTAKARPCPQTPPQMKRCKTAEHPASNLTNRSALNTPNGPTLAHVIYAAARVAKPRHSKQSAQLLRPLAPGPCAQSGPAAPSLSLRAASPSVSYALRSPVLSFNCIYSCMRSLRTARCDPPGHVPKLCQAPGLWTAHPIAGSCNPALPLAGPWPVIAARTHHVAGE
jgi:hypothetical protein